MVFFHEPALTKKIEYKLHIEKSLKKAINKNQISLVYQPKIDSTFHKVTSVEALARWYHPELGHVSPVEFIEVAERIGIIDAMSEWILYQACYQAVKWKKDYGLSLRMSVNISPITFLNKDIIALVNSVIKDTGIEPHLLELEVTESVIQTDPGNLLIFEELKKTGIRLAIDDFGVGYSSLASLKHIKIDCLKIDQYFVKDMLEDINSKYLITSMIDIGHNFGYEIIAEGVENKEQLIALKELECDTVQGYFISKPLEAGAFINWLTDFNN